jgi:putative endonuclease
MNEKQGFVYIMSNKKNGTLYVGVTNDLVRRVHEHKHRLIEGFTSKYHLDCLVWFDSSDSIESAISIEKKIKNRGRAYKIGLIEKNNPTWQDLSAAFMDMDVSPTQSNTSPSSCGSRSNIARSTLSESAHLDSAIRQSRTQNDGGECVGAATASTQNDESGLSEQNDPSTKQV